MLELRATLRSLWQRPSFTLAVVVTLALGIGATTAVFSVVNAVLVRPLPYREPDRLIAVWPAQSLANREIDLLRNRTGTMTAVAGWSPGWLMTLTGADLPRQLTAARITGNLLEMIGTQPLMGRAFGLEAERSGADKLALLSNEIWRAVWGADPALVGRSITLNGEAYTVVGVMPPAFQLFDTRSDLWIPLTMTADEFTWTGATAQAFGRMIPGETVERTSAEVRVLAREMESRFEHPADWARGARVLGLKESLVGGTRATLGLLLGAVAFLLLIAVANVANLLVVRTIERRQELAVRASLGASSGRIGRLLLTEGSIIALFGGLAGVALAFAGVAAIGGLLPPDLLRTGEIAVDARVLGLAGLVTLGAALGFSLAPLAQARGVTASLELRVGRGGTRSGERVRRALVAVEVGLAVVLLSGAALMSRTMAALAGVDPGLKADHLLTAKVQPRGTTPEELRVFWREALPRVASVPGVVSAGTILHLPTSGRTWSADIEIEGQPLPPGATKPRAAWQSVSTGYFTTALIPLIEGRVFDRTDLPDGPRVVVVNQAFAARLFPGRSPVGTRIKGGFATANQWATIIGVVGGVRHDSLNVAPGPEIYLPFEQKTIWATGLVVRTRDDPTALAAAIRAQLWSVDREVPVTEMRSMENLLAASLGRPRMILTLIGLFAGIGVVLGAVGIYGVVAFGVRQRLRELGIRAALGARADSLTRLVARSGLGSAVAGLVAGLPVGLALSVLMRRFVFGIEPTDPISFGAVALLLLGVAGLASWIPARAAGRVDPARILRD